MYPLKPDIDPDKTILVHSESAEFVPQRVKNSERIAWLEQAYALLRQMLLPEAPERITIVFGFPSKGSRPSKKRRIGEFAHKFMQGFPDYPENSGLISLHPTIFNTPSRVLDVLLHEMIHAVCPEDGHRRRFPKLAKRCGLNGKMTATVAGPELQEKLEGFLKDHLPPMPPGYGDLNPNRKKQTTRMLKYVCPACGQIIRAAKDDIQIQCVDCDELYEQS